MRLIPRLQPGATVAFSLTSVVLFSATLLLTLQAFPALAEPATTADVPLHPSVAEATMPAPAEHEKGECYWDGTAPFCMGSCKEGYVECATSTEGDGNSCVTGYKRRCCLGGCNWGTGTACYWDGTAPLCNGSCREGYTECGSSKKGDGEECLSGFKKRCCKGGGCGRFLEEEQQQEQENGESHFVVIG
jgi:hypothetical protein